MDCSTSSISDLTIGFVLGLFGTLLFEGVKSLISPLIIKRVGVLAVNPWLSLKINTPFRLENKVVATVKDLFRSWETKNLNTYASCWHHNGYKITGHPDNPPQYIGDIQSAFIASTNKYSQIKVKHLLIEGVDIKNSLATITLSYRFSLTRTTDELPIIEEAQEVYRLGLDNKGVWKILANYDHFKIIQK